MPCDTGDLKTKTYTYWTSLSGARDAAARDTFIDSDYIDGLLRMEIACAKARAVEQEGVWPREQAGVLVFLVGHSIEPLLQTVCAYQPLEIVLVLSQKYGKLSGQRFADERVTPRLDALKQLSPPLLDRPFENLRSVWPQPPQGSQPGDIFQLLLQALREDVKDGKNIVIDITGGKKSMVAGAYFFAAYTNAKISYVDFEDYHEEQRRPYGFSCQIGLLPNPYEIFGLRDWEQVKSLYERFFFDEALRKLCSIIKDMPTEYFQPEQIEAVECLIEIMRVYQAWSIGDYARAKKLSEQVRKHSKEFRPLASVEALHLIWPQNIETEHKLKGDDWSFYANHERILQYVLDESAKVDRIVKLKEDYRSGLLRAAGLNEVLLKARLVFLWQQEKLKLFDETRRLNESETLKQTIEKINANFPADDTSKKEGSLRALLVFLYKEGTLKVSGGTQLLGEAQSKKVIAEGIKAYFAEAILQGENERQIPEEHGSMKAHKAKGALPYMSQSPESLAVLKKMRKLRNDVIHFVIPISKQTAYDAVEVMHKNVQDFEQVWVKSLSPDHKISPDDLPDWDELCAWCKIDFLPYQKKQEKQL